MKHKYNLSSCTSKSTYFSIKNIGLCCFVILSMFSFLCTSNFAQAQAPTLTLTLDQPISCNGSADGSFFASASPTNTYVYNFNGGSWSVTDNWFGLAPGTYTVGVTDGGVDTVYNTITFIEPDPISVSVEITSLEGCVGNDGEIIAHITGGTRDPLPAYATEWTDMSATLLNPFPANYDSAISGLSGGSYALMVTDYAGCMYNDTVFLSNLCLFVDQHISCNGANDGTVQASTTNAGTWLFGIDGGGMTNPSGLFLNLTPGNHTICMTDGSSTYCDVVEILEPDALTATFTIDSTVSCHGGDGQITININGGTAVVQNYLTLWTNATGDTLNNQMTNNDATTIGSLPAGNYFVRVEDDNGCVINVSTTLTATPTLSVTATADPTICTDLVDTIRATTMGGDGLVVSTIGTTVLPAAFAPGTYTVVATDARGCTATTLINLSFPQNSTSTINVSAGNAYTWSANSVTYTVTGTYTHTLTGANSVGCDSILTLNLQIIPLTLFVDQHISCFGANDGTVQASTTAIPSPGPWMFGIDGGSMNNPSGLFLNLTPGYHTICATDGTGTYCDTVFIIEPSLLTASFTIDSTVSCHGNDGQITININGGTAVVQNYLTLWTNTAGDTLNDQVTNNFATTISSLPVGNYFVRVEDDNGCVINVDTTLLLTPTLMVTATADPTQCHFTVDTIRATTTGGDSPIISTIGMTVLPAAFAPGTYTVVATDSRGCTATTVINLSFPQNSTSTQTVYAANSYFWSTPEQTYTISGTYTHTLYGANAVGCDSILTLNLHLIPLTLFVDQHISCFGANDGTVQASTTAIPNPGPWMFSLDGGPFNNPSGLFLNLTPGYHTICANDGSGSYCDEVFIIEPTLLTASFTIDSTVSCHDNDGQITININGGTAVVQNYLTLWTNTAGDTLNDQITNNFATTLSGLPVGNYFVRVEDDNGCVINVDTTLVATPTLSVTATADPTQCHFTVDTIRGTTMGGDGLVVSTIGTTVLPDAFAPGTYTVVATDSRGCTATTVINLSFPQNSTSTQTVYIANAYTWAVNSQTYTVGGMYVHTLVGANAVGCDSIITLDLHLIPLTLFVDQHISCFGANDGTVQASTTAIPNPGPWMFGIDGGSMNNPSGLFLNLTPGYHTICATDGTGTYCDTVFIIEPSLLTASFTIDSTVSCHGNDGQITININGGTAVVQNYLTLWTNTAGDTLNDQITNNFATTLSGLPVGNYFVRVEDDNGCVINVDTTLDPTPAIVITPSNSPILCFGGSTSVSATATGGLSPISFAVGMSSLPTNLTAGTYTIVATDAKGCTETTLITLTQPPYAPTTDTVVACNEYTWSVNNTTYTNSGIYTESFTSVNGCDSSKQLTLTVNYSSSSLENVVAANSYTWMGNGVTYTVSGTYTHTLVGGNAAGCDSNMTLNLNILNLDIIVDQHVSCNGNNNGSAQATPSGIASGTFTYDLDGANTYANTTGFFIGLTPGTHTICAKHSPSNAVVCNTVLITEPAALVVTLTVDSTVSCLGNDGQITAHITGGTNSIQPYLTTWSSGVTPLTIYDTTVNGLAAGTYTVTVEDDHLCFATATVTVGNTPALTITASNTTIICNGGTSVVTYTVTGGTGANSVSISGGTYTVTANTYTLTATDAKGCTATTVLTITEPASLLSSQSATSCDSYNWSINSTTYTTSGTYVAPFTSVDGCDSSVTLNLVINYSSSSVENVVEANSYTWMGNGVTYTVSGTYTHTLVGGNAAGCDSNMTLNLNILNLDIIVDQHVSCNGNNDGSAQATPSGIASGTFTYDLDGANTYANTTGFFIGLTPGTHTICAKHSPSNAVVCNTVLITEPTPLVVTLTVDSTVSCLGNDGQITAHITGGTNSIQPYLTTWSSGVTPIGYYDTTVSGLAAGTYTVTVEDDHLCFASATVSVGLTPALVITASNTPIACFGGTSVVTYTVTGGTGANSVTISGGTYTVNAGTYTLTATDAKGCTATAEMTISQPALLTSSQSATACDTYTWSVNSTTYTNSGTYVAPFTSVDGCDSSVTLNLIINYSSSSMENVVEVNSYTWMGNGVTYTVSGTYTHTLVGGNAVGCDSNMTLNLNILNLDVVVDQQVSCNGNNDGSAQATPTGIMSGSFTYDLDGANTYANITGYFIGLTPGTHTICAKHSPSNVVVCNTVLITEPAPLVVTLTVDSTVSCQGNDGQITAHITGGTNTLQPYLTTWSSGVTPLTIYDTTVNGLAAGTYTVTVEDDHLCFATATITVVNTPALTVNASFTSIACFGGTSVVTPTTSGGTGAVTTSISGGTYTVSASTYTLTATDAKGCTATSIVTITEPALLTSTLNVTTASSYFWSATGLTYTTTGTYTATLVNAFGCDSVLTLNLTLAGISVAPKVFLAGPYVVSDNMMHDSLRAKNFLPTTEPYTNPPYSKPSILDNVAAEKVVSPSVLAITGNDAIVDWVFVELRDATTPATIVATKRALLQRDGDVVSSVDGVSPLYFAQNAPGNYYVTVKHRNHLGVMTAAAVPLSFSSTLVDFTTLTPVYNHVAAPPISNTPRKTVGSVSLLWAGDANTNKNVKYNGLANDKNEILNAVGVATPNNTLPGYRLEDVNMDGIVRYNNADNDKNYILNNTVGVTTPNVIINQHTPN